MKKLWILSLAMSALMLGSKPVPQVQRLPLPDCTKASPASTQAQGDILPDPYERYAWTLLSPDGCPAGLPNAQASSNSPRLQDLGLRRLWIGASRALQANSARVPGSPQRLEAHNLTVASLHRFAALPMPLASNGPAAVAVIRSLERALALDPELATAYWLKASLEAELERHDAAIADFEHALALPNHPLDTAFGLATSLLASGNRQAALYAYEDLMAETKAFLNAPDDLHQATPTQFEGLANSPGDAPSTLAAAYLGRGDIHQAYGRCDLAKPDFEVACKLGLAAGCERICPD